MKIVSEKYPFQESLVEWFEREGKSYPWRETRDPWSILVSEVMLQQTQVTTVLNKGYFTRFLEKFPTTKELANASESEILKIWEGLGYYRRVRNLQKAAKEVETTFLGVFPLNYEDILNLPGVGKYTAGAVSSFAYNLAHPIVDANVARIFSRIFDYQEEINNSQGIKQLWQWAGELLDEKRPQLYNSALMELGQQVCTLANPQCEQCPIQKYCTTQTPNQLPKKKQRKKTEFLLEQCILWLDGKENILLAQAGDKERRTGFWALPQREEHQLSGSEMLMQSKYSITHYKVQVEVYPATPRSSALQKNEKWIPLTELVETPISSPYRKIIQSLLEY